MTRQFGIGFLLGFLIFAAVNLFAAHLASDCGLPAIRGRNECTDDIARAGWPPQFYEEGGVTYHRGFNPFFLLLNTVFGLGLTLLTGWLNARRKGVSNSVGRPQRF